jgi:hypothetical protein
MLRRRSTLVPLLVALTIVSLGCGISFMTNPEATATEPALPAPTSLPPSPAPPSPTSPPVEAASPTVPPPTSTSVLPTSAAPSSRVTPGSPSGPYAVILVLPGDVLNIRSAAGADNPIVGSFAPTAGNVMRTGPSALVGGSLWVEVQRPAGGIGWVNSNFLTEQVSSSAFCADSQVTTLLTSLRSALLNSNGEALANLSSPTHGLDLRLWRYGTLVNYDREHAKFVFESTFQANWGPAPGSGDNTVGSFSQAVLPKLTEVFGSSYQFHCNDTLDLATFSLEPWPPEYANLNFYAVHKPGTETYGGLDWRTWLAGVEYVSGKPYLFSLIHFQWEP